MAPLRLLSAASALALAVLSLSSPVSAVPSAGVVEGAYIQTLRPRADYCTTETVVSGDSCASLVERCGITADELLEYNSDDLCSTLVPGQRVCCSEGSLTPQKYDNGTCYTYTVNSGDNCYDVGLPYSLSIEDIEEMNNGTTWGWTGCASLVIGMNICLSDGNVPMPSALDNAICGPQVPGTTFNGTDADDLAALNPCPLNSCCNIWGQCGIDGDYCTESVGPSGNPGTSEEGIYGCISNCGTDIVNNDDGPADGVYKRVGYYESYNWDRDCLRMRAAWSNTLDYTHMHWAFGTVGADASVYVDDTYSQWDGFMSLDVKRIISFGGWGFSTSADTYDLIRQAMSDDNRDTFVANLVAFVDETGVDGIDFDWEYPGAPDIPGIPTGLESDGPNYLATLKALREALPDDKTISIAAPASYWYLKAFPIAEMSEYLDYIVYMAYDLHGQWDWGNEWSQSGCPTGNCLRSHVNETEVRLALAMVTKAGVASNKIMVGEASYGRSFNMATAGCTGPECFFTGSNGSSDATPGRCTATGGYIANAEIMEIIDKNGSITTWYDDDTATDYLVYDDLQWVAYMSDNTKQARRDNWEGLNFLGTIDWAVDLQSFTSADQFGPTGDYDEDSEINVFDDMVWDWVNPAIAAPVGATNIIMASPLASVVTLTAYTTITLQSDTSISTTFVSTAFSISELSFQAFTLGETDTSNGTIITYQPVPRVTPDPMTIEVPMGWTITSGATTSSEHFVGASSPTSTSSTSNGFVIIGWLPTVSYKLPARVTPKTVAPTTLPDNEDDPAPGPPPGVTDCSGDDCTAGVDCSGDDCTRGGDCVGPSCTKGGGCVGPNCVRGGGCEGDNCENGGDCEGDSCVEGGPCSGTGCTKGGGCKGSNCSKGGPCANCEKGDCVGDNCSDCDEPWCDNRVTVTIQPANVTPKPACLTGCPTLAPCADGGTGCNEPCNTQQCPISMMPTAKDCTSFTTARDCTEFVSSSAVQTSPTTSWSTTTRTYCETIIDCEATGVTMTTTQTESESPQPTADLTSYNDDLDITESDPDGDSAAAESAYSSLISAIEANPTTSTTSAAATHTVTPLEMGTLQCFDASTEPGHGDLQENGQQLFAIEYCKTDSDRPGDFHAVDYQGFHVRKTDSHGVNYDFTVTWSYGCVTTTTTQNFLYPLGEDGPTCMQLMAWDMSNCTSNEGIGGKVQVGCLTYAYAGGLG